MDLFEPVAGVDLKLYATLCAKMADTNNDETKEIAVAEAEGVSGATWLAAKKGWSDRMMDDAKKTGKLAHAFMPLYQAAQAELRGGAEPMDLPTYARIAAELAFKKGPDGKQVDQAGHLATLGMTITKWGEISGYWVPRVNDPANPEATTFRALMQAESDRIFGIVRGPAAAAASAAPVTAAPVAAPAAAPVAAPAPAAAPAPQVAQGPFDMLLAWLKSIFG